jgi:hypothetical protein
LKSKHFIFVIIIGSFIVADLNDSIHKPLQAATEVASPSTSEVVIETEAENDVEITTSTTTEKETPIKTLDSETNTRVEEIKAELNALISRKSEENKKEAANNSKTESRFVPFYSQILDITPYEWKGVSCGIAGLAMLIDYYKPAVNVDSLLQEGIDSGSYDNTNGWSHAGLIDIAGNYGLKGQTVSLSHLNNESAVIALKDALVSGPVMASVHYTLDPKNTIPHLVVVSEIKNDTVYYNDPASLEGGESISVEKFILAWKKRYIEIRPV